METDQDLPLQPNANYTVHEDSNHKMMSNHWIHLLLIATAVKSILGLIILFLLLGLSIIVFIIGFHYRESHHCPIEPNISLFLIISGSASIEWIILSMVLSIITIILHYIRSIIIVIFIIVLALIIAITNILLFIWMMFGSIWTLKVFNTVQYADSNDDTFCRQTLYRFTLVYLMMTYVFTALQCWYRLCIVIFCSVQNKY